MVTGKSNIFFLFFKSQVLAAPALSAQIWCHLGLECWQVWDVQLGCFHLGPTPLPPRPGASHSCLSSGFLGGRSETKPLRLEAQMTGLPRLQRLVQDWGQAQQVSRVPV